MCDEDHRFGFIQSGFFVFIAIKFFTYSIMSRY